MIEIKEGIFSFNVSLSMVMSISWDLEASYNVIKKPYAIISYRGEEIRIPLTHTEYSTLTEALIEQRG